MKTTEFWIVVCEETGGILVICESKEKAEEYVKKYCNEHKIVIREVV